MKTNLVLHGSFYLQNKLYSGLNSLSESHKTIGRFCALPVTLLDVALDTLKIPLSAIEYVALAALNLLGASFSEKFTLKDALVNADFALGAAAATVARLATAPFKLIFQLSVSLMDPAKVQSINFMQPAFKA